MQGRHFGWTSFRGIREILPALLFLFASSAALAGTCTVDATQTNQFIRSIGASSAWSGIGTAGQALFGIDNSNGHIGLSSLRARIDPNNSFANEVNTLAAAKAVNPNILLWATEWSPPAQYKGNNNVNGNGTNGDLSGNAKFTGAASGSPNAADTGYANYLVSFVQYAQSHGVSLYAVSVQNEPNWNPNYEAAVWSAGQFNVFVPVFHTALQNAGFSTKIMIPEPVNPGGMNLASTTMNDPTNSGLVSIIATHLYGGTANPLSSYGFTHVTNQEWWETEVSGNTTDIPGALQEAGWIQSCLVNAGMNSFSYWWLTDLLSNNNLTIKAYVLGNYSKFIRPGYYRMGATAAPTSGISVSAFKNTNTSSPQTIVFVAINNNGGNTSQTFSINGVNVTSVTPWVTDGSNNLVAKSPVAVSGGSFTYSLTGSSVTSFIGVVNGSSQPTNTPTNTNTPVPPTATFTRTNTALPPTATFTATRTNTPVVFSTWRVNAGGPSYTDTLGNVWSADTNFTGGSTIAQGTAISGTSDSTLYDTQRYGTFSYSFNVPNGTYQVTLKLAETYSGNATAGARIFSVSVNGTTVVSNLDLFAQVGANAADDKVINNISPSGGVITIQFASTGGTDTNALVEAIQIIPQPANTPTLTSTRTNTSVPPTATFTAQPPTMTFTAAPPTNTRTSTPVPPTATSTNTPAPPTATFTAQPPTMTFTAAPPTNTRTNTPVPPTATRTNTPVPPTATFTPVPPTATPTVVTGTGSISVQLLSGVTSDTNNSPHPQIQVSNTGSTAVALNNVTVRYWFNCDCTNQTIQAWVDWAGLQPVGSTVTSNVHVSAQAAALGGQTGYILYSFTGNMVLQAGQKIQIQSRFNKSDWSNMTQSNDWSYAANTSFINDTKATGYFNGGLVWGQEPAAASASLKAASVVAFPNPSTGSGVNLSLSLSGSGGTSASVLGSNEETIDPNAKITFKAYSLSGRLIWSTTVPGSTFGTSGTHTLYWDERDYAGNYLANGVYFLVVTVESEGQMTTAKSRILVLK